MSQIAIAYTNKAQTELLGQGHFYVSHTGILGYIFILISTFSYKRVKISKII